MSETEFIWLYGAGWVICALLVARLDGGAPAISGVWGLFAGALWPVFAAGWVIGAIAGGRR